MLQYFVDRATWKAKLYSLKVAWQPWNQNKGSKIDKIHLHSGEVSDPGPLDPEAKSPFLKDRALI